MIKEKLTIVRKAIAKQGIDTLMVTAPENRRYLSGFTGKDLGLNESAGALFITDLDQILATDFRYVQQAKVEAPEYLTIRYKKGLVKELPNILKKLKTKRLGFEGIRLSYYNYEKILEVIESEKLKVKLVQVNGIVENMRIIKSEQEILNTAKAVEIAEQAFKNFCNVISLDMTEKRAAWELEKSIREAGADSLSFPVICASGPNSAMPHAVPGEKRFKQGEPIIFDWGAKIDGYCSDMTRTLTFGKPDHKFLDVYNTVLKAQSMAIDEIRPGISSKKVDSIARSYIEKDRFKGKFGHGLGHGTGLSVHEEPSLSFLKDTKLMENMIITVEPGIYLPGWGGVRIENQVVVRERGAQVFNKLNTGPRSFNV